jgi:hypothetical protein
MAPRKKVVPKKKYRSPLSAIHAYCLECSGGNTKERELCHLIDCPLYYFRTTKVFKEIYGKERT